MKPHSFSITFDLYLPWMLGFGRGWGFCWLDFGPWTFWWNDREEIIFRLHSFIDSMEKHQARNVLHFIVDGFAVENVIDLYMVAYAAQVEKLEQAVTANQWRRVVLSISDKEIAEKVERMLSK